ncbi:proline-rich nuclear receptor coactivator 1-like isoform X1 [Narcine bancroftii]|uniref:proline-rich nuclear receptor coactivator 1-like isoform X1 n=1 Tax=Narcine bancroftii TaxID=1343680 RepID=UPI0038310B59
MVTARHPWRPFLRAPARSRKRWRWPAAMHPLPLACPPSTPLPVSACSGSKVAASHRQRLEDQPQTKTAAGRGRTIRSTSSTITLLPSHTPQPGPAATSTSPRAPAFRPLPMDGCTSQGEVRKSNMGRYDEIISPHIQFMHCVNKTEDCFQVLNAAKKRNKRNLLPKKASVKINENRHSQNAPSTESCNILKKEGGKLVTPGNHNRSLKLQKFGLKTVTLQGDQNYAGPKFSEPPSPSVLPKPPSHWVGVQTGYPEDGSKEIMTVHLKTLLKVSA